jgi:hypothetical protein
MPFWLAIFAGAVIVWWMKVSARFQPARQLVPVRILVPVAASDIVTGHRPALIVRASVPPRAPPTSISVLPGRGRFHGLD